LADLLDQKLPPEALPAVAGPAPALPVQVSASMSGLSPLDAIQTQLQVLTRQVELLRQAVPGGFHIEPDAPEAALDWQAESQDETAISLSQDAKHRPRLEGLKVDSAPTAAVAAQGADRPSPLPSPRPYRMRESWILRRILAFMHRIR
jgi:hypothetical protein